MANLTRLAKASTRWTTHELRAFNIQVRKVNAATFFGLPHLPKAPVSHAVLHNRKLPEPPPAGMTENEIKFLDYLSMASWAPEGSAIIDLVRHLLYMSGYQSYRSKGRFQVIRTDSILSFYMGDKPNPGAVDLTLMRDDYCLLVVGTHKSFNVTANDPEPPLIAQSIAAFATNHVNRGYEPWPYGVRPLSSQAVPGMTMVGTSPIFYRTIATESLLSALCCLTYPPEPTVVLKFVPPVPHPPGYPTDGMVPLDNRRVIFQCLEAFKRVIGDGL